MKKLIALSLALLLSSGVAMAYSEGDQPNIKEASGSNSAVPVRVYMLVRYPDLFKDQPSLSEGDVVIWDTISDDGVSINLVDSTDITGSSDAVAGVVVSPLIPSADSAGTSVSDIGKRNWGYIQTYGINEHAKIRVTDAGTATVGFGLRADGVARYACTVNNSHGGGSLGFALDTVSSNSEDVEVFIRAR